jgi:hypothetical protein
MDSQQSSKEPTAEEKQQGVAYPPPPSYYENMQPPAELPPLPEKQSAAQAIRPATGVVLPSGDAAGPYYSPSTTGRQSFYAPGQYSAMRLPATNSRRQTWIIVAIIGASVLLLCGAGGWALSTIFGAVSQEAIGANQVVQDFYQHVLHQDYSGAYADLHINGLTTSVFAQNAQAIDTRYGQIASFNINSTSFNSASSTPNVIHWQITVNITRLHTSYSVPVSVDEINGNWLITAINLYKF